MPGRPRGPTIPHHNDRQPEPGGALRCGDLHRRGSSGRVQRHPRGHERRQRHLPRGHRQRCRRHGPPIAGHRSTCARPFLRSGGAPSGRATTSRSSVRAGHLPCPEEPPSRACCRSGLLSLVGCVPGRQVTSRPGAARSEGRDSGDARREDQHEEDPPDDLTGDAGDHAAAPRRTWARSAPRRGRTSR